MTDKCECQNEKPCRKCSEWANAWLAQVIKEARESPTVYRDRKRPQ